jgi:signal transduction histidine kinase
VSRLWQIEDVHRAGDLGEPTDHGGGLQAAAVVVLVVSWSVAAVAVVLYLANRPPWSADQWYFVVDLADGLVYGAVAFVLLSRVRRAVAWLIAVTAVGGALAALGFQWGYYQAANPDLPTLPLLTAMQNLGWVPGTLALVMIVPWLVRDEPLDRFAKIAIGASTTVIVLWMVLRLTDPFPWPEGDSVMPLAIRDEGWLDFVVSTFTAQIVLVVAFGLLAAADVVRRWLTRPADRRRGLGWLAIGTVLITVSFVPLALPIDVLEQLPVWLTPVAHLASQLFFPAAILVVVLRQRLWGTDLAVSRAVSWGLLTAMLTVAYVAVVSVLAWTSIGEPGVRQVIATAFVAAGFQPVKVWVQQRVNHLVFGDAAEPMNVVRRVGRRVGSAAAPEQLLDDAVAAVRSSLRLGAVEIVMGDGDERRLLASTGGSVVAASTEVPLVIQGQEHCRMVVSPRPGERLDARSLRSLTELAPVVAAAVQLSATAAELSRSRARLTEARDEERRRLRRELHDGLGPALAGIGLALQASRNLLASDPGAASDLLEQMVEETDRRVQEVRRMARDLLPPTLEGEGLVPALIELAELHRANGIAVEVHVGELDQVPSTTATAAYAIASEALRNVVRHATATSCSISVDDPTGTDLVLVVVDDGHGIDDDVRPGVGLLSMREWAEGAGGSFELSAAQPHGTRVTARIPVAAGAGVAS